MPSSRKIIPDHQSLSALMDACDRLEERSTEVLGWAKDGRAHLPAPPPPTPASPAARPDGPRLEADLAPAVEWFLQTRGLVTGREYCVYPSRRSRRRTVADLVAVAPRRAAVRGRMKVERRRVTVAEFWPALLQTLTLAPEEPFRRQELLARLQADPLTRDMPAPRLSRYLRTLRRYGYLRQVDRIHYLRRSAYLPVADGERTAAVELKRRSYRAGLAQALSYARVIPYVWIATGSAWPADPDLTHQMRRFGIGALEVLGDQVREVIPPAPGRALDPRFHPYRQVLEERVVREQVLGRPRAFA